jgi:hypothetical protein
VDSDIASCSSWWIWCSSTTVLAGNEFGLIIFSKSVYVGHDDAAIGIYKEAKAKQIRLVVSVH